MGFFSKFKKKIKKAIPKEIAPFLPALASIYGGPMLASMFGSTGMLGQGIGAFLADAGTQELTSDRTRLESSLMSGIFGAARGMTPDASLMTDGSKRTLTGPQTAGGKSFTPVDLKSGDAYKAAFKNLGTGEKIMEGARSFASAPLDNPISMASASTIGVQAAPKLGYNEVERLNKDLASRAAASAKARGLSYEESMKFANQYFYGSNPGASEADYNAFMEYYNSDLQERLDAANGGRIGFADGSQDYMGDVYGDRDRDSLDMKEFYKEYPETQVGSYINENRYKSEKIEKLEAKLNEIIDMRQRTADRSRNPENDGMPSLMEKLLDKEINSLYADRTNDDVRKSEAQKRDEMNARFDAQNAEKQQMIQDYYNNLGVYARPGRAMGGIMNPRMGYARGTDPYMERYRDKVLDPFEGGFEPGDGPDRFPDYEGVNPFNKTPGNASVMGERDRFLKARIMQIEKMFEAGQISREEAIIQMRNVMSAGTVRATMNMGGSMNMMDRPNFNYGSGRQTPQGDPIAPNVPPGMQMDLRPGGFIELGTEPRADDVPAMVGKDEFVLNDRAVAGIGKALTGRADPRAGARALYDLQSQMEATV